MKFYFNRENCSLCDMATLPAARQNSLCHPQNPWCVSPPPTSTQLFLPPWLPVSSTRRSQVRQMWDNILAEGDKQRSCSPFLFERNYLLCELLCFLLSTSSPDRAVGASQSTLSCFGWAGVLQHSCWGRVQVQWAPAGGTLTERWHHFTAPHKSASRFCQICLMTVSETWQQHWADTSVSNLLPQTASHTCICHSRQGLAKRSHNT